MMLPIRRDTSLSNAENLFVIFGGISVYFMSRLNKARKKHS